MDCIHIENLEIFARHGVYKAENQLGQLFIVSADLYTDTRAAALSDSLKLSVDYGAVCHRIKQAMEEKTFKLIESAAEYIAEVILNEFTPVRRVRLTLKKPWAPIGLHLDYAGITIERGWHTAMIGIGSNMGDSSDIVHQALKAIDALPDTKIVKCSGFFVTKPYGHVEQNDFLNGCAVLETIQGAEALLDTLLGIEKQFLRERNVYWGPRTLDLDILFYDSEIIHTQRLCVPHPDMENRRFVLEPLAQIAGAFYHPVLHKSVNRMYHELIEREEKHD